MKYKILILMVLITTPKPDKEAIRMQRIKSVERYDATYQFGNTTVHVVAPKITEEENQRRLDEIQRVAWVLWEGIAAKEVMGGGTN